jgi:hypothetical protein
MSSPGFVAAMTVSACLIVAAIIVVIWIARRPGRQSVRESSEFSEGETVLENVEESGTNSDVWGRESPVFIHLV